MTLADTLLDWYDRNARTLPWRIGPAERSAGTRPDPYRVWLSEIMLQQTTVATVGPYFARFTTRWPTVEALAVAPDEDVLGEWAGLGYYARARNLLKCARHVAAIGGFPQSQTGLQDLPGIGPYTSAAIAAIAFDVPATVLDGNVERVVSRLFDIDTPLPAAKVPLRKAAETLTPKGRPGCFAQGMMDLGATICTPRNPACGICPLFAHCAARKAGTADGLPVKAPKKVKPTRFGHIYVLSRPGGAVLMETRPEKGLLGGMPGFVGSDWAETAPDFAPPVPGDWTSPGKVKHTFTHFHLILTVHCAVAPNGTQVAGGRFVARKDLDPGSLPTLMRKVWALACEKADA